MREYVYVVMRYNAENGKLELHRVFKNKFRANSYVNKTETLGFRDVVKQMSIE